MLLSVYNIEEIDSRAGSRPWEGCKKRRGRFSLLTTWEQLVAFRSYSPDRGSPAARQCLGHSETLEDRELLEKTRTIFNVGIICMYVPSACQRSREVTRSDCLLDAEFQPHVSSPRVLMSVRVSRRNLPGTRHSRSNRITLLKSVYLPHATCLASPQLLLLLFFILLLPILERARFLVRESRVLYSRNQSSKFSFRFIQWLSEVW